MATGYTVEKLGYEDIDFGTGTFQRKSRLDGNALITLNQVNASHFPQLSFTESIYTGKSLDDLMKYAFVSEVFGLSRIIPRKPRGESQDTLIMKCPRRKIKLKSYSFYIGGGVWSVSSDQMIDLIITDGSTETVIVSYDVPSKGAVTDDGINSKAGGLAHDVATNQYVLVRSYPRTTASSYSGTLPGFTVQIGFRYE